MTFHSVRPSLAKVFFALAAALLLGSCGGGGGASSNLQGGQPIILPATGTAYAGVPFTFSVTGGRRPYTLSSSEPSLLPVPLTLDASSFTTIPSNPGVVDANLQPGELPVRTVRVTARDTQQAQNISFADIKVAINFLTGYGVSFSPNNCPAPATTTITIQACAGGTTAVRFAATTNGNLHGDKPFRVEVVRGNFAIRNPSTGQAGSSATVTSDHAGNVLALIEVPAGTPSQVAVIRVVDVATGVYADTAFVITGPGTPALPQAMAAIPNEFTFTGPLSTICGTGTADFLVFDGLPPYTATSTTPSITVTPTVSSSQPGRFTINAFNRDTCLTDAQVVITDSAGNRTTVKVTTKTGSTDPVPPPDLTVSPNSITLACGMSGSVAVVGGNGSFAIASANPNVSATVSGNVLTITRAGTPGTVGVGSMTTSLSVTDGKTIQTVTVTSPATCP